MISAVTPRMPSTLKMLDPTMLPIAISDCRRKAAIIDVASSGRDVPTATMVRQIDASVTPKPRAIDTDSSTKNHAPNIKVTSPATIHNPDASIDVVAGASSSSIARPGFR